MPITSTLSYTHTSETKLRDLYGDEGYDAILQELGNSVARDRFISEIIDEATQTVDFYLNGRYDPVDYTNMPWVKVRCTWIAAHFISMRTAQPGYWSHLYEKAIEELLAVKEGDFSLPGIPLATNTMPSMSNIIIDDYYGIARQRVDAVTSVGDTYSNQHIRYAWLFQWL